MRLNSIAAAAVLLLGVLLSPIAPAGADDSPPHLQDISGDANGLGRIVEVPTSPASYGAADLVSVELETAYTANSIGEDGIDYRPTGLRVVFKTFGSPADIVPGADTLFGLSTMDFGRIMHLEGVISKSSSGVLTADARLRLDGDCAESADKCWERSGDSWTAEVDETQNTLTLTYPFSSLTTDEQELIGVGSILWLPAAQTVQPYVYPGAEAGNTESPAPIDRTPEGRLFIVGADVPEDVDCTDECLPDPPLPCFSELVLSYGPDDISLLSTVDHACRSSEEVGGVEMSLSLTRCPDDSATCSEHKVVEHCVSRRCEGLLIVPHPAIDSARYDGVVQWTFGSGGGGEWKIEGLCRTAGLEMGCSEMIGVPRAGTAERAATRTPSDLFVLLAD